MKGALAGLDPCVHCGFCLQACPTYLATGDEADSPRGRIVLMQSIAHGLIAPHDTTAIWHLDRCLDCRACEPACPSGVKYGESLGEIRVQLNSARPASLVARAVAGTFAEKRVRRPLMAMARLFRPLAKVLAGSSRVGFALGMLAATAPWRQAGKHWPNQRAKPSGQAKAALFRGCVMESLFPHIQIATRRTLMANGVEFTEVSGQGCCGALYAHNGLRDQAKELALRNVAAFARNQASTIVVDSAGCGAMLKEYARLLVDTPLAEEARRFVDRVRDVSELLAARGPREGTGIARRVVYDPPCHLLHAQRVSQAPLQVMRAIPGIDLVLCEDAGLCCGSAGTYNLTQPELARAVLAPKLDQIETCNPDVVATGNPGCIMQIGAALAAKRNAIPVLHPVELLDYSYELAGYYG